MNKNILIMVILIGVLLISIVQGIEIKNIKAKFPENSIKQELSDYDKMMQEHHGGEASASNIQSQVGGC